MSSKNISAIILGAGKDLENKNSKESLTPISLIEDQYGESVLKWNINSLMSNNIDKIRFVGGYEIEKIGRKFPNLEFVYNALWDKTGVLESLYQARKFLNGPVLISYGDIVYSKDVVNNLIKNKHKGVVLGYEKKNYSLESSSNKVVKKNIVSVKNRELLDIGFLPANSKMTGEFIGLVFFNTEAASFIRNFFEVDYLNFRDKNFQQSKNIQDAYLTDLLRHLLTNKVSINCVDVKNDWQEINNQRSLVNFVIGTKSETLSRLKSVLNKSKLCDQFTFNINEWNKNRKTLINSINKKFSNSKIAVRSSSFLEDSFSKSNAGAFESILNIDSKNFTLIERSIDKVIASYSIGGKVSDDHQVLIQNMVEDVYMSGVVFTKDMETGAPYYIISYDNTSSRTDTVTSGSGSDIKTLMINKFIDHSDIPTEFFPLIQSIIEIEDATGYESLDIEFAINNHNEIYILQVRPIVSLTDKLIVGNNKEVLNNLSNHLSKKFTPTPNLFGKSTIYADMPDWNPAEMIGSQPKPLAYSMYDYLITEKAWRLSRESIGYFNPKSTKLMTNLLGHPFIDVRASFNNLTPADLPKKLFEKLINYYLDVFKSNPDKHDKVEFEILFTCLDFSFDKRSELLIQNRFSKNEIKIIKQSLFNLTDGIISGTVSPINKLVKIFDEHSINRKKILNDYSKNKDWPITIKLLLDNCVKNGTIPFSILARYAFIANSLLRSLVETDILSYERLNVFLNSINTVATDLVNDVFKLKTAKIKKSSFLKKYGHLRPGTYDITSKTYKENYDYYFNQNNNSKINTRNKKFILSKIEKVKLDNIIKKNNFSFNANQLIDFSISAISMREYGKFEFTKSIANIFDIIDDFGSTINLTKEDLSFLNIYDFINILENFNSNELENILKNTIKTNKEIYERNKLAYLPHIIMDVHDVNIINIPNSRPNFVTTGKVSADTVFIGNINDSINLDGKIVLIEGADPGFDWIFAHNIVGLITKYGGSASHMTIRANEFNLPSAIGCGENLFSKIVKGKMVELNCAEKYINVN
ncbi:hypothetical protein HN836_01420 [Candidatus Woesearchaeota archaeon]|jgi:glutamine kinase|nr:hypothetical protein [Candidatus Woesearchaeota archaeon]